MAKVIGIDLGTTNSCVAVMDGDTPKIITNDEGSHPTIKGYRVIADELATFIKKRGYIEESLIRQP